MSVLFTQEFHALTGCYPPFTEKLKLLEEFSSGFAVSPTILIVQKEKCRNIEVEDQLSVCTKQPCGEEGAEHLRTKGGNNLTVDTTKINFLFPWF